ncbi:F-box protein [Candidatus Saccharibacteria bacterium]|nr:F-box protein [Candidatus Saccharibacteria bacterium]
MATYENLLQSLVTLPPELIDSILAYLEPAELLVLRQVSTGYLRKVAKKHIAARKIEATVEDNGHGVKFTLLCRGRPYPIFPKGFKVSEKFSFLQNAYIIYIWEKEYRDTFIGRVTAFNIRYGVESGDFNWDTAGVIWLYRVLTNIFQGIPSKPSSVSFDDLIQKPRYITMGLPCFDNTLRRTPILTPVVNN